MIGAGYILYGIILMVWFIVIGWKLYGLAKDRVTCPDGAK